MKAYKVVGYTNPVDYATRSEKVEMVYFKNRKKAQKYIDNLKTQSKYWMQDWKSFRIEEIKFWDEYV